MRISFSGIYDIRFPAGTKPEQIDNKCLEAQAFLDEKYKNTKNIIDVKTLDWFNSTKSDKKLADKGIRISTTIDNPWILCDLFERIDKSLGQQYVDKSKVELVLDTKA